MTANVMCLDADGQILGLAESPLVFEAGAAKTESVRIPIVLSGRAARIVIYVPEMDISVESPTTFRPGLDVRAGDTVTIEPQRGVLMKVEPR